MNRQLSISLDEDRLHPVKAATLARRIRPEWHNDAACADVKDPEVFFPEQTTPWSFLGETLTTCAGCPVRRSCLAAALLRDEIGIWAGTDRRDRRPALVRLAANARVDLVLDELLYKAHKRAKDNA